MSESATAAFMPVGRAPIEVEWALVTKQPDSGYAIQDTSDGALDFDAYVGAYVTGTPNTTLGDHDPGALPWVTFGTFVNPPILAVSINGPFEGRSNDQRRILPRKVFLIKYADLRQTGLTYRRLWDELENVTLPWPGGRPYPIRSVPSDPVGALLTAIERYGLDQLASLAGLVLDRPVVLAGADYLRRHDRLDLLDALAALLPYGFRANFSAASAADNTVTHNLDFVFADFSNPRNNQVKVHYGEVTREHLLEGSLGRTYADLLLERIDLCDLATVVDHLWGARGPYSRSQPQQLLLRLAELGYNEGLRRNLENKTATFQQLEDFLKRDKVQVEKFWKSLTQKQESFAFKTVLGRPAEAVGLLARNWRAVNVGLRLGATNRLDDDDPNMAFQCLAIARKESPGAVDSFLAELIDPQDLPRDKEKIAHRQSSLVTVFQQSPLPGPHDYPATLGIALTGYEHKSWPTVVFRDLLNSYRLPGASQEAALTWARWLCGGGPLREEPPWVSELRLAVGPGEGTRVLLDPEDLDWLLLLLWLTGGARRLRPFFRHAREELLIMSKALTAPDRRSEQDGKRRQKLREAIGIELWAAGVEPSVIPDVDVARALLGGDPAGFAADNDEHDTYEYFTRLDAVISDLDPQPREVVARKMLEYAVPPRVERTRTPGSIRLLNTWSDDPVLRDVVAEHITRLHANSRPVEADLKPVYWENLKDRPGLESYVSTQRLGIVLDEAVAPGHAALIRPFTENGLSSSKLAYTLYDVFGPEMDAERMVQVFAVHHMEQLKPYQLNEVLVEFHDLLTRDRTSPKRARLPSEKADLELQNAYLAISLGGLGKAYGKEFEQYLRKRFPRDIGARRRFLWILTARKLARAFGLRKPKAAAPAGLVTS